MLKRAKAFSIMEMLLAAFLITIAFVSLLKLHTYALAISTKAKEISTAGEDAADIMEKIDAADFPSLSSDFPDGCCIGASIDCGNASTCPGASDVVVANEMRLGNETVVVNYPLGSSCDPRGIQVTVSWVGRDQRHHCDGCDSPPVTLTTIDTKGM